MMSRPPPLRPIAAGALALMTSLVAAISLAAALSATGCAGDPDPEAAAPATAEPACEAAPCDSAAAAAPLLAELAAPATDADQRAACTIPSLNVDRSLFVSPTLATDQAALRARFSLSRVLTHVLASSGAARPAGAAELFHRWWDTQNSAATAVFADNPHCDDAGGTVNGYPVSCPRNEGALAAAAVSPDGHVPIALVYRPDLAPRDGSYCGEARVVFAKPSDAAGRNLLIFEAAIPNPEPGCGVVGCRRIAAFWAGLSAVSSFSLRLAALERFYFTGFDSVHDGLDLPAALDAAHFGLPDGADVRRGQIRTNQFMTGPSPQTWQLREFQLARACTAEAGCKLYFEPVSVKTNPWGGLFDDLAASPLGPTFRDAFLGQLSALAPQDVNAMGMTIAAELNAGQSTAQGTENRYAAQLALGDPTGFRQAITDRLAALGLPLTADDIAARATAQSCAGCHQLSNNALLGGVDATGAPLKWPPSAGFVHVREDGTRSTALDAVFLPRRKQIFEQFLRDSCAGVCPVPVPRDATPLAGRAIVH